jgi:NDP-sugar pyrophosphorylase family protein
VARPAHLAGGRANGSPFRGGADDMQAVILAGGLGTRLWPLTQAVPKPMVPVAGVPYLARQLQLLAQQQIRDIVMLTGYLGEQIESYFENGAPLGLRVRYSREPELLGTGGALRHARALLDDWFLVIYGDSYLPVDYAIAGERLRGAGAAAVVIVFEDSRGETGVRPNIALDAMEFVIRYDKSQSDDPDLRYIEAGVLALRRDIIDLIPPGKVSLEQQIFPQLIARRELAALRTEQRFYDIGTPERLKTIEGLFA